MPRAERPIHRTIAAANYLPQVRLLHDSLLRAHGEVDFRVLLVEHPATVAKLLPRLPELRVLAPDEISCAHWLHMAFYYEVMEYATALKPFLIRTLLREGAVVYLDPDIEVFSSLDGIEVALAGADVVLTPHVTRPLRDDGHNPSMKEMLHKGQFNLGFIGVGQGAAAEELMAWWQDMLVEQALASDADWLFTDQMWAAAFASLAPRLHVLRSARYNVAYWNVFQRHLTLDEAGQPQTEDGPLAFYHYSGLQRKNVEGVSRHQTRIRAPAGSPLHRLLTGYLRQLDASPLACFASHPYSFATYTDGVPIPPLHRRAFLRLARANRWLVYNPFAERTFMERVMAQSPTGGLSELEIAIARYQAAEWRLNSLPYSLIGRTGQMLDKIRPGSKDRVFNAIQYLAWGVKKLGHQIATGQYGQAAHDLAWVSGRTLDRIAGRT